MKHPFNSVPRWLAIAGLGGIILGACKPKSERPPPVVLPSTQESTTPEPAKSPETTIVAAPAKPVLGSIPPPLVRKPILEFGLPTKNRAIFDGPDDAYFMFVDRSAKDPVTQKPVAIQVWQGGQYGFVRDPKMLTDGTIVYSRFHEGMDVAPVERDARGEPLDAVFSIADGTVMFANTSAGKSNYGNYVIIRHDSEDGPFFSLSAHFREVKVARGTKVKRGDLIGMMGHTGAGIDRRRSHTHVELNMLLNERAAHFDTTDGPSPPNPMPVVQKPGAKPVVPDAPKLNGQNLVGLDIASWLRATHEQPMLRLSDFIRRSPPYFKVRIPNRGGELEIVKRYPWLRAPGPMGESWEITIAASSIPLKVQPIEEKTDFPHVVWVRPFTGNHSWMCREMLTGSGNTANLSAHGNEYLKLIQSE